MTRPQGAAGSRHRRWRKQGEDKGTQLQVPHPVSRAVAAGKTLLNEVGSYRGIRRVRPGALFGLAVLLLFSVIWGRVLIGRTVMVGGDVLYCCRPWSGSAGVHPAANLLAADPVDQFLPWLTLTAQAFAAGELPLWDPLAMAGAPLLANDQSAPFSPFTWIAIILGGAQGYGIAMLAKMWVAGVGMVFFTRLIGAGPLASGVAGLSYACCSFMVVWLGWPHTAVAALLPWVFASIEWYLRRPSALGIAAVSTTVALQFLAGHAETSLHLGVGACIYCILRCLSDWPVRFHSLIGLAAAAGLGAVAASVQLLPFSDALGQSSLVADRLSVLSGIQYLPAKALATWLAPNLNGNPAIDHRLGLAPNYNESTGFAGVGALALAAIGAMRGWAWTRSATAALLGVGLFAAGTVYGVLTHMTGQLPGLSASYNVRMLVLLGFVVAALAGLGLEALLTRPHRTVLLGRLALGIGLGGLGMTLILALTFVVMRVRVEDLVPQFRHNLIGFWALVAGTSTVAAVGLCVAGWLQGGRAAATALVGLALVEAALFAGPYQPQVPGSEVPPPSIAVGWLQDHAGETRIAATGLTLLPETSTLYGLADVRGYDVVRSPRVRAYWSRADPGFRDDALMTDLEQPKVDWLAAAGVGYVMTPGDQSLPGTDAVFHGEGVTIGRVPDARPFAFAARTSVCAQGPEQAGELMTADGPLSQVVLESGHCPMGSDANVRVVTHRPGSVQLDVVGDRSTVVVVLQTYTSDWRATVDGKPEATLPADILFQAVEVPAGHHHVSLTYDPQSVSVGALLSMVAAILIVGLGIAGVWDLRKN